ncbi:MAG: hypothetical protein KGI91_06945 [Burkholderiales bacterium]|nr:hypothetical protein [Burkholderiales bacterium]MDE2431981.1 hypothetical protein [Burkholderiales bacterium]
MNIKSIATLAAAVLATSAWAGTPAEKKCGAGSCSKKVRAMQQAVAAADPASKEASCSKKEASCSKKSEPTPESSCSKKEPAKDASCSKK